MELIAFSLIDGAPIELITDVLDYFDLSFRKNVQFLQRSIQIIISESIRF